MPISLVQYVQTKRALKRVAWYLTLPELWEYVQDCPSPAAEEAQDASFGEPGSIAISKGTFSWFDPSENIIEPIIGVAEERNKESDSETSLEDADSVRKTPTLRNLDCRISAESLVVVVGPVGRGKSSLFCPFSWEKWRPWKVLKSTCRNQRPVCDFVSYCAQTPWVINDSMQGNILFGRPLDPEHYYEVFEDCALRDHLKMFPAGDQTEIGERGITLYGGQEASIFSGSCSILGGNEGCLDG
jgi:ABC-type multidrug transport system fused ATPase/permease subunit